jgi:hypothetical protein
MSLMNRRGRLVVNFNSLAILDLSSRPQESTVG